MTRVRRKPIRDAAGILGKIIKTACSVHTTLKNPVKYIASKIGDKLIKYGTYRKRVGMVRGRAQAYNPRIGRWVKFDTTGGQWRIISVKKTPGPYKNIRKVRGRRKRR